MSLNKDQLTEIIETYIKYINDLKQNEDDNIYWNADIRPTKENWGLTFGACIGDNPRDNAPADDICTSNYFGNGWQCNGFARFVGYLLTGTEIPQQGSEDDPNNYGGGWIRYTDLTNYEFCPGDILEIHDAKNHHSAIVVSANGDNVSFFEAWGGEGYGCKIEDGVFNGGAFYDPNATNYVKIPTTATNLRLYAKHVIKCPPIEAGTPAPKPDKYIVNTRFYQNHSDDDSTVHTGTHYEYVLGDKFGSLPVDPELDGYTFAGWYTDRTGGTLVTSDSVVSWDKNALYAHWTESAPKITVTFKQNTEPGGGPNVGTQEYTVGGK